MNDKIAPGGHGRPQYLLRCAFKAAEEGDRVEAMHYWELLSHEGYAVKERTRKQLLFRIRQGEQGSTEAKIDELLAWPGESTTSSLADRIRNRKKPTE